MIKRQFLGLDLSTQSLTALVISPSENQIIRYNLNFDRDLPQYNTQDGVPHQKNPNEALLNPLIRLIALEYLLMFHCLLSTLFLSLA